MNDKQKLALICGLGLITRLAALPFAQVVDADSVTRVLIAENLLHDFRLITQGIWLPIHHYLNALAIFIGGERVYAPKIMNILFAVFTAVPVYYFTKREFSKNGAWFAALIYVLCPVVFRNSFHALAGVPYAFLVAHSLNYLSKSIRTEQFKYGIYAGLFITLASGFRYEAWVLIAVFAGILLVMRKWKLTPIFWIFAVLFPVYWMIGNYIAHNDIFYGLSGAYNWNIVLSGVNENVNLVEKVRRFLFFPFSWFFLFSPIVVVLLAIALVKRFKRLPVDYSRLLWVTPFIIMSVIFIYKAYGGTLLLQHRFTITLILLSAPLTSLIVDHVNWTLLKKVLVALLLISLLPLSYLWMEFPYERLFKFSYTLKTAMAELRLISKITLPAVPRLQDQTLIQTSNRIEENLQPSEGLIMDFLGWDKSYFLALRSDVSADHIFLIDGAKNTRIDPDAVETFLDAFPEGVLVLKCFSKLSETYRLEGDLLVLDKEQKQALKLVSLELVDYRGVFRYQRISYSADDEQMDNGVCLLNCPEKYTKEYFKLMIRENTFWYMDIKRKAREKGISVEESLELDAEWLVNDHRLKENTH